VVHQGAGLGPARRRPAVPGLPGGAAAERRRHPPGRDAVPGGRAPGDGRRHGRTGGRLGARRRPRDQGRGRHGVAGPGLGGRRPAGTASGRPDRRGPARPAVGGGGQAAPGEDRAPLAARLQRAGRPGRPARDRRLQLLRAVRHAAAGVGPVGLGPGGHRLLGADLPGQRRRAARRRRGPGAVLARGADPGCLLLRQPGLAGQRRRDGAERAVPAESRRRADRGRGRRRGQLPRRSPGPPGAPGDLLRLGGPRRRGPGVQAARRAARCWPSWRPWPRSSAS